MGLLVLSLTTPLLLRIRSLQCAAIHNMVIVVITRVIIVAAPIAASILVQLPLARAGYTVHCIMGGCTSASCADVSSSLLHYGAVGVRILYVYAS